MKQNPKSGKWLMTLGVGSFVFFLLKGLVWLGVGAAAVYTATR